MIDTNRLSLSHPTFAYAASPLSRHSIIDAFATIAWFKTLATSANASSIADMVRYFATQEIASPEVYQMLHRQWTERSTGRRRPAPATIEIAEVRCAGSAQFFELALWPSLRTDWQFDRCLVDVSRKLPAHLAEQLAAQLRVKPEKWESSYVRTFSRRGTLNDLACLLILLRRGNDAGSHHAACGLGRAVHHVLLLQAGWLLGYGLLNPLVEYVDQEFFQKAPQPAGPWVTAATYSHMLDWLVKVMPRYLPEVANGFDAPLWTRGASLALQNHRVLASTPE